MSAARTAARRLLPTRRFVDLIHVVAVMVETDAALKKAGRKGLLKRDLVAVRDRLNGSQQAAEAEIDDEDAVTILEVLRQFRTDLLSGDVDPTEVAAVVDEMAQIDRLIRVLAQLEEG